MDRTQCKVLSTKPLPAVARKRMHTGQPGTISRRSQPSKRNSKLCSRVVELSGLSYSLCLKALLPVDTQQITF